jgi:DNA-binding transcriptional regulator LsrR (DeoR family)
MARRRWNDSILREIAEMYYERDLGQNKIAERYKVTPMTISRLLKRARERGIVQVTINRPIDRNAILEEKLETKFNLEKAIVVVSQEGDCSADVVHATAMHVTSTIVSDSVIGLGVGPTLLRVIESVGSSIGRNIEIVQLVGGFPGLGKAFSHDVVYTLCQKLDGKATYLNGPFFASTASNKKIL